ncbi:hypothetical protein RB195_000608 [Necator americanus]|uniref:Uncharacterized protein n=1 Tax=Necator americanus TaxID=51031 RepID=A0ABR1DDJ5_NECAM
MTLLRNHILLEFNKFSVYLKVVRSPFGQKMFLRPLQVLLQPLRFTSTDMRYVERMRLLEYWGIKDTALTSEFRRSQFLVMIDRKPLVRKKGSRIELACLSYPELQGSLGEYGFSFDTSNSCLLDAIDGPDNGTIQSTCYYERVLEEVLSEYKITGLLSEWKSRHS